MNTPECPGPDAGTPVSDPVTVAELYQSMLVPNFPGHELITVEELVESVAAGTSTVRVIGDPHRPAAIAVTDSFTDSPAVLLAYFATRADQRGGRLLPEAGLAEALRQMLAGADPVHVPVTAVLEAAGHPEGTRLLRVEDLESVPVAVGPSGGPTPPA